MMIYKALKADGQWPLLIDQVEEDDGKNCVL